MAISKRTRASDGSVMYVLDPMPKVHVGVIHQPERSSVVVVDCGQITLFEQRDDAWREPFCNGYANGLARGINVKVTQLVDTQSDDDVCELYAKFCDGSLKRGGLTYTRPED